MIGQPYFFQNQKLWFSSILDFCQDKNHIYVLYTNDIVDCYSYDGQYIYSVSFKRKLNGESSLYRLEEGFAYEDGFSHSFYIISSQGVYTFVRSDSPEYMEYQELLKAENRYNSSNRRMPKATLRVRGANVFADTEDGTETCITSRPAALAFIQDQVMTKFIAFMTLLMFIAGMLFISKNGSYTG